MAGNTGARPHSRGRTRHNCAGLDSNKIDKWALRVGLMSTHQAPSVCALPSREGSSLERHQSAEQQPASCCGMRRSRKHAPKTRSVFACLARSATDFAPKLAFRPILPRSPPRREVILRPGCLRVCSRKPAASVASPIARARKRLSTQRDASPRAWRGDSRCRLRARAQKKRARSPASPDRR